MNQDVLHRVLRSPRLPSLPTIALEVLALAQQQNADIQEVAHTIQHDPALSSKILRTVNSAFYGYSYPISTVNRALVVLGAERGQGSDAELLAGRGAETVGGSEL